MPLARHWPQSLCPSSILFQPNIPSASGGVSMGGGEQITFSSAGRWEASFSMHDYFRRSTSRLLAARAMVSFLKGKTNRIYIGPYDYGKSPGALSGNYSTNFINGIPHSDGSLFGDGSGYSQGRTFASLVAAAEMGDLSLTLSMPEFFPQAGQYFGYGYSELYLIDSVEEGDNVDEYDISFWPTLRNDHAVGAELNFDTPTCEMRLSADNSAGVTVERLTVAGQRLELVEAI